MFEVPNKEPTDVATASANNAFSIFVLNPFPFSIIDISSSVKIPLLRPVPINVPIVSNVSVKLKAKIASKEVRILGTDVNNPPIPLNAAKNTGSPTLLLAVNNSTNGCPILKLLAVGNVTKAKLGLINVAKSPTKVVPIIPINYKDVILTEDDKLWALSKGIDISEAKKIKSLSYYYRGRGE